MYKSAIYTDPPPTHDHANAAEPVEEDTEESAEDDEVMERLR